MLTMIIGIEIAMIEGLVILTDTHEVQDTLTDIREVQDTLTDIHEVQDTLIDTREVQDTLTDMKTGTLEHRQNTEKHQQNTEKHHHITKQATIEQGDILIPSILILAIAGITQLHIQIHMSVQHILITVLL